MARYLLDTHVLLWAINDDPRLSEHHRDIVANGKDYAISIVSIWEAVIKQTIGKLQIKSDLFGIVRDSDVPLMSVELAHVEHLSNLPHHHGDPFDRMLIAQAQAQGLTILTGDRNFAKYDVSVA